MKLRMALVAAALALLAAAVGAAPAGAEPGDRTYEVTITNLTSGQPLTPPVVATHNGGFHVFRVGRPASFGVKEIAENGNLAPLLEDLAGQRKVSHSLATSTGPLVPDGLPGSGAGDPSVTFQIEAGPGARYLSFVSMLICTNDGFTGVDRLRLPNREGASRTVHTNGYDAGTEVNTEDFADIVPPCQSLVGVTSDDEGTGTSDPALAEGGVIHHHAGILGVGDLDPTINDWTNPVAMITVERIG
jgi:hypothetical protein